MKEVCSQRDVQTGKNTDNTDDYKRLISLLVGSQYVSFNPQTKDRSFQSKSDRNLEKNGECSNKISSGATQTVQTEFPDQPVTLGDLSKKKLGHIKRKGSKQILITKKKGFMYYDLI